MSSILCEDERHLMTSFGNVTLSSQVMNHELARLFSSYRPFSLCYELRFQTSLGMFVLFLTALLSWKIFLRNKNNNVENPRNRIRSMSNLTATKALERKRDFLSRVGKSVYGFRQSPLGYIDDWRPIEFPFLIHPLAYSRKKSGRSRDDQVLVDMDELEVYLDYAGSALPMKSQLERIYHSNTKSVLANPHSTGPAASRTLLKVKQAKARVLKHFHAMPGRFASLKLPDSFQVSKMDCHSGYELLFTSGATESFKIVAERFPWQPERNLCIQCNKCRSQQSILLYVLNSHNSVVGMRQEAKRQGGIFHCVSMEVLERMNAADLKGLEAQLAPRISGDPETASAMCNCNQNLHENTHKRNLLVFPSECNFGGYRPVAASIISVARECGWYTMLDIAKAASTGPVNLRELDPDFAALSFYKMFGDPTGLGALLVKRSSAPVLFESDHIRYQGGGSVSIMTPREDFLVVKNESPTALLESLTSGTIHFRGIVNLVHGFDCLEMLGGMEKIHQHAICLATELVRRLRMLRHKNGLEAIQLYGAWDGDHESFDFSRGPTIAFNVIRQDGSIVGYNEVSKLAALHRPPIQIRSGCFCNPGACQHALGLSDQQAIDNFVKTGHVCGDHIDLVEGRPTGAIRVSFGKDSIWEDMDTIVQFLMGNYVSYDVKVAYPVKQSSGVAKVEVGCIYIFPIKSCSAQGVQKWKIELPSGKLKYDREFALVDTTGTALRLQSCPELGLISPRIDPISETMTVSAPGYNDLIVDLSKQLYHGGNNSVQVCGDKCGARLWGDADVSEWFSSVLGIQCWLARFSDASGEREMRSRSGFSNEQPLLLISENAVDTLNAVLIEQGQRPVDSKRFRPNLVVKAFVNRKNDGRMQSQCRHIEDDWKTLTFSDKRLSFKVEGGCPRCTMVDYDPSTGAKGKTLRALASYRRRHNGGIVFGIFLRAINKNAREDQNHFWIEEGDTLLCS